MSPLSRREFGRVMGATLALAGVSGCAWQPAENIVPYVDQPERLVPGKPLFFATAYQREGYATGLLGESHMGRPIKLEGNPQHPASLGATDAWAQASILTLYDPDRSQAVRYMGDLTTWDVFIGEMTKRLGQQREPSQTGDRRQETGDRRSEPRTPNPQPSAPAARTSGAAGDPTLNPQLSAETQAGSGIRLLTGTVTSPSLTLQLRRFLKQYPGARITRYEPVGRDSVREGLRLAFGVDGEPVYHFDQADRIISLDCDFLSDEPGSVRYAREFAAGRRVRDGQSKMNRLYAVESCPTITGASADHRLPVPPASVEAIARALAVKLGALPSSVETGESIPGLPAGWTDAVVKDLQEHRGSCLVIAGAQQPANVHALAFAINFALGALGKTLAVIPPVSSSFSVQEISLGDLTEDLNESKVQLLFVLDVNPVYDAPADLNFPKAMNKADIRVHLGLYDDETGVQCHWHIPQSHYLEAWSDTRAFDATASIVQPLIKPLYATKSAHEILAALLGEGDRDGYDIVRSYWKNSDPRFAGPERVQPAGSGSQRPEDTQKSVPFSTFDRHWHDVLVAGVIPNTAAQEMSVTARPDLNERMSERADERTSGRVEPPTLQHSNTPTLQLAFRADPTIWDGRFANNGWLQELPKPLSSLTWDNVVMVGHKTAAQMGLRTQDVVEIEYQGRKITGPIWVQTGHPNGSITVFLGYGRTRAGRIGTGNGYNAYRLRTSDAPFFGSGARLRKTGDTYTLATTQRSFDMHDRDLARSGDLPAYLNNREQPPFMEHPAHESGASIYLPTWPSDARGEQEGRARPGQIGAYAGTGYNGLPTPAWGMVIDLNACIGCNACVVACQSENNSPTVGKDQVVMHRMMQWMRIDTYYTADTEKPESLDNPRSIFQPVTCHHCENAPCEPVCPVEATSHSAEGINEMTYNRCIGTRYCSNNCPYKVRRFNFLQYSDQQTPTIQLMANPDVTVRSRGVMEKCTYCIQRINEGRIQAEKEGRPILDGDVITACQQVCPTQAIVFGNINDKTSHDGKGSQVRQLKEDTLNYTILDELNTRPRTSYLAKLRNENPEVTRLEGRE